MYQFVYHLRDLTNFHQKPNYLVLFTTLWSMYYTQIQKRHVFLIFAHLYPPLSSLVLKNSPLHNLIFTKKLPFVLKILR